jgi:hypothetical protein
MKASSYTSSFLTADDVKKPRIVHVQTVAEEKVGQDTKLVLYVDDGNDELKIALNKSNIARLIEIFGDDETDNWIGNPVEIWRDPNVMFNNRKVGGIAFRKPKDNSVSARPRVEAEDSI